MELPGKSDVAYPVQPQGIEPHLSLLKNPTSQPLT